MLGAVRPGRCISRAGPKHDGTYRIVVANGSDRQQDGCATGFGTQAQPASQPPLNSKPAWTDLTPAQQQALKPLAGNWASLSVESKRKWLAISKSYPNLPPSEQAKAHSRMSEWVSLSQQQRTEARLNFAETKKLPPQEKATQWQSYQELSPEAKKKLAAQAPATPAGAAVVKPIPQKKLTEVPVTPHTPTQGAKLSGANQSVHQKTLLPQAPAQAETAPKQ